MLPNNKKIAYRAPVHYKNPSIKRLEATLDSSAADAIAQESTTRDHVLLTVQAVINSTPLRALVDSGTTCSFIDEKLRLHPPLEFIGASSSLEVANGETIVSTGVAPDVLVSIGKVQFQSCLTNVPMIDGFELILCKDWLDMINPLVDWRNNTVFIRFGDELHTVTGIPAVQVKLCGITD